MTISCAIECDGAAWWWSFGLRLFVYDKNRGKRCCSCGSMVRRDARFMRIDRWRACVSDIEERIYGDEFPLSAWVVCEQCAPILVKLSKMNVDVDLGGSNLHDLLSEFEALYQPSEGFHLKLPVYQPVGVWV